MLEVDGAGLAAAYGTFLMVRDYRGPLFEITRASDRAALGVFAAGDGKPGLSALRGFLAGTTGFFSTLHDQRGAGRHATQAGALGSCPRFDFDHVTRGAPEVLFDTQYRGYLLGQQAFRAAPLDARTLRVEGGVPWYVLAGCAVTGDNVQPSTTVSAVDYAAGAITLDRAPAAPPGPLRITPPAAWLDIPPAVEVPWTSHGVMMAVRHCEMHGCETPILLGQAASVARDPLLPFQGLFKALYRGGGLRFVGGNNGTLQNGQGPPNFTDDAVLGYSTGGRHGKVVNWLFCGEGGTNPEYGDPRAGMGLAGGSIGYSPQVGGSQPIWGGTMGLYGAAVWGGTLPPGHMARVQDGFCGALGIDRRAWGGGIVCDGSSTTAGNGTVTTNGWPTRLARLLRPAHPAVAYNTGQGATIEWGTANFGTHVAPLLRGRRRLAVYFPAMGNSIQAGGRFAVAGQRADTVLEVPGIPAGAPLVAGAFVGGPNIRPGTQVLAAGGGAVTLSCLPLGPVASLSVQGDTGAQAWLAVTRHLASLRLAGARRIVLVGSASRGSLAGAALAEFRALKALAAADWPSYADAYVDLESDPGFAGDAPWASAGAAYWQPDRQHFTGAGYGRIAELVATAAAGLL